MTDEPRFASATKELALVARHLRDARAAGDPQMIAKGHLTEEQAADRLRIADALAADWSYYAELRLPSLDGATSAEKEAMLERSLAGATSRRDRAHAAMVAEAPWTAGLERGALWQLIDAHLPNIQRIEDYLHWESYSAAIEALLWWQRRDGVDGKRFAVEATLRLRADLQAMRAKAAA